MLGSAHGKVILVGEHFAVHGGAAIALPVRARSIAVEITPGAGRVTSTLATAVDLVAAIRGMLADLAIDGSRIDVEVRGDLPLAAGLGGSAALAAALVRALGMPADEVRGAVHRLERLAHGNPSGVDGAVVCLEMPVWFEAGVIEALACDPTWIAAAPFWIAIVPRVGSTREAVAGVATYRAANAAAFARAAIEARAAAFALRDHLQRPIDDDALAAIGVIFDGAEVRLEALGVSNDALRALINAARAAGGFGAKLTGAGLGGAVIAVAPDRIDLEPALRAAGAIDVIRPPRVQPRT